MNKSIVIEKFSKFRFIFLICAILFTIILLTNIMANIDFIKGSKVTEALITNMEVKNCNRNHHCDYTIHITYTIDGLQYSSIIDDVYNFTMDSGDKIKIYYNEDNPSQVIYYYANVIYLLILIIPSIIIICSGIIWPIRHLILPTIKKNMIIKRNNFIITSYELKYDDGGKYLFCKCFNPIKNNIQEFTSDYIEFDNVIDNGKVKIYLDKNSYYVDLNSISVNDKSILLKKHNLILIQEATKIRYLLYISLVLFILLVYQLIMEKSSIYNTVILISFYFLFFLPLINYSLSGFAKGKKKYKKLMECYNVISLVGRLEIDEENQTGNIVCIGINPFDMLEMEFKFPVDIQNTKIINNEIEVDIYISMTDGDYYTDINILKNKITGNNI